jgi:lactoylglutathione lyase
MHYLTDLAVILGARTQGDAMRIEHVALWTEDVDRLAAFYQRYFEASVGNKYVNAAKGFESRFVSFATGARLEIMRTTLLAPVRHEAGAQRMGLTHFAVSLGSEQAVDELTDRLRHDGHPILDGPRRTGDGYYESVTLDPDGNRVELIA